MVNTTLSLLIFYLFGSSLAFSKSDDSYANEGLGPCVTATSLTVLRLGKHRPKTSLCRQPKQYAQLPVPARVSASTVTPEGTVLTRCAPQLRKWVKQGLLVDTRSIPMTRNNEGPQTTRCCQ